MDERQSPLEALALSDRSFWSGRSVLVTGHTGFKGAWLALWLERLGARVTGFALPPECSEGAFHSFEPWQSLDSRLGDLREAGVVEQVMMDSRPEFVFHLGAQSLVRRGWIDPLYTYEVNVLGTASVLEAAGRCGNVTAIIIATSDKVYANENATRPFAEDSPLGGSDPYSASKAAAEFVVNAWRNGSSKIPVATVRAGNVIGGGDVAEDRLLPDAWRAIRAGVALRLRNPLSTRPWQFVIEPLLGYLRLAKFLTDHSDSYPHSLNFGPPPSACWPVARVAEAAFSRWGGGRWVDGYERDGAPEAPALRLDADLADKVLQWRTRLDPDTAIRWTVDWWRAAEDGASLRSLASRQIDDYVGLLT